MYITIETDGSLIRKMVIEGDNVKEVAKAYDELANKLYGLTKPKYKVSIGVDTQPNDAYSYG